MFLARATELLPDVPTGQFPLSYLGQVLPVPFSTRYITRPAAGTGYFQYHDEGLSAAVRL